MPGLIRKLVICASTSGLIIRGHGAGDHPQAIQIDYETRRITDCSDEVAEHGKRDVQLEAHGLIGLLSIASSSFLIAITRREQVAQILGKPVYVVTDVAFLPLSSRQEASKSIAAAVESAKTRDLSSESDYSDSETEDAPHDRDESGSSPTDDDGGPQGSRADTSIAQDVFAKRGQFGHFASQWFSRQGWGIGGPASRPPTTANAPKDEAKSNAADSGEPLKAAGAGKDELKKPDEVSKGNGGASDKTPVADMIPKILRVSRLILASRSFFFAYDLDLTRSFKAYSGSPQPPVQGKMDPLYFWNKGLGQPILDSGKDAFLIPILQGFVGQRSFVVKKSSKGDDDSAHVVSVDHQPHQSDTVSHVVAQAKEGLTQLDDNSQAFLLTLISRRSVKRSGLRYLRRGIDDDGNCANAVETEQILSPTDWSQDRPVRSFMQYRASIPLYFSQSPYSFKPIPMMRHSQETNDEAMVRHFKSLADRYGEVQAALLVDKHATEAPIGEAYEKAVQRLRDANRLQGVSLDWFDFHAECRGMKFENVDRLVQKLKGEIERFGETVVKKGATQQRQSGIIRTNCMDCLDRTNVAESAFGQYMLQTALEKEGFAIDLVNDEGTTWFNTLWADNGDAISRQYAGTAALKGDFTRTRKRDYRGALNDFSLTLTRYYNNMVNDYFSQAVIDVLIGSLSWKAFEDFETRMMSADPGLSVEKVRENAIETCRKQIIQDETEDLVYGSTMLAPAHDNTLRSLPFTEAVVLLTDAALYLCKFDWTTEKVSWFEKVDLRSISKIRHGTYITSTLSDRQMDEALNKGVVVVYHPGKGSMVRTNTRSLSSQVEPSEEQQNDRVDGGTGVLSWLAPRAPPSSKVMALKIIPVMTERGSIVNTASSTPAGMAQSMSEEIVRAMTGSGTDAMQTGGDMIEKADIISLAEAKKRTGYLEHLGHSIKKMVWS